MQTRWILTGALALVCSWAPSMVVAQAPSCTTVVIKGPANVHPTSMSISGCDAYGGAWIDLGNGQQALATYYFSATNGLTVNQVNLPPGYQVGSYQARSVAQRSGSLIGFKLISPTGQDHHGVVDAKVPGSFRLGPLDHWDSMLGLGITQSGNVVGDVGGILPAYGSVGGTPVYLPLGPYAAGTVADGTDTANGSVYGGFVTDGITGETLPVIWQPNGQLRLLPLRAAPGPVTGLWMDDSGRFVYYLVGGELHGFDMVTSTFDVARDPLTGQILTGLAGVGVTPDGYVHGNGPNGMFSWKIGATVIPLTQWWGANGTSSTAQWIGGLGSTARLAGIAVSSGQVSAAFDNSLDFASDPYRSTSVTPEPATLVLLGSGLVGVVGVARRRRRSRKLAD